MSFPVTSSDAKSATSAPKCDQSEGKHSHVVLGTSWLPDRTILDPNTLKANVSTDTQGNLSAASLGKQPVVVYCVVADYNGEGEYTEGVDAYTVVWVVPALVEGTDAVYAPATLGLTSTNYFSQFSQAVTFIAVVTRYNMPTGTLSNASGSVALYDGSVLIGVGGLVDGIATVTRSR